MKKIVLIGDSIRMGYDKYVKEALAGTAEVYYPDDNCRFSYYVLRYLHEWKAEGKWPSDVDLVHWNAGLWDCLELFGDSPLVPIASYEECLLRITARLRKLFPNAKHIFATSTPIVEAKVSPLYFRHNTTIEEYNAAAVRALTPEGTIINDLYAHAAACPAEYRSDAVHYYTDAGTEYMGRRVLAKICSTLDIKAGEVNLADFRPEEYSTKKIGY